MDLLVDWALAEESVSLRIQQQKVIKLKKRRTKRLKKQSRIYQAGQKLTQPYLQGDGMANKLSG